MRLKGKTALITGADAGIGWACAELFAREGACVGIAELDAATGEAACRAVQEHGGKARAALNELPCYEYSNARASFTAD